MESKCRQGNSSLSPTRVVYACALAALLAAVVLLPGCGDSGKPPSTQTSSALPIDAATMAALDRGVGELGMFEFASAEATFAGVLQTHPQLYAARLDHAISILNQTGEGAQLRAIELLDGILRDYPGDTRAEYCQALGYLFLGDPSRALPRFRRASDREGVDPYAHFYAGQCSELQGELEAARGFYQRAAELDPYLRSALLGLQRVEGRLGHAAESAAALEVFQRLADNPRSHLAEFKYTRMGSLGEAVLPESAPRELVRRSGPMLANLDAMPIDGLPPAPATVAALLPTADLDGDGTLDFIAQIDFVEESRVERRMVRSSPDGRWKMDQGTTDAFRRGRQFWGDLDNDGKVDVVFGRVDAATRIIGGGVWAGWAQQTASGQWRSWSFVGVTEPGDDIALCADLDHDGDLDLVFTNPTGSGVLWNLGRAGSVEPIAWERRSIPGALSSVRATAADLEGDGDLDLLLWSVGGAAAQAWRNDRLWAWTRESNLGAFESSGPGAVVVFRRNEDGHAAIATLVGGIGGGTHDAMQLWESAGGTWTAGPRTPVTNGSALWVTDISGSGHANIVVLENDAPSGVLPPSSIPVIPAPASAALAILDAHGGLLERMSGVPAGADFAVIDARGPVAVAPAVAPGGPARWMAPGSGRWPYAAVSFRGRIDPSQQMRTNSSGIGTRMDARIGGEWVARDALPWRGGGNSQALEPIAIGLGDASKADFVAIDWPDAVTQTELAVAAGTHTIVETQRQISSCPVIFAWNGTTHAFITDCLGVGGIGFLAGLERSPTGSLHAVYPPARPWERVTLGGADVLAARHGAYEIRLGEPMEEACYLDAARLIAWDVPAGWQVALDERMAINGAPPTGDACFFRTSAQPVRAGVVVGEAAESDQTKAIITRDGVAAHFGAVDHRFIGRLAKEAVLTIEFADAIDGNAGDPALLVDGWVEYPYSSTGFAMWQASAPYKAPSIEARDPETGVWKTVVAEYGYPAGMSRRAVFPLLRSALPPGCTALRVRTTMEIYVDAVTLAWFEPCAQARRIEAPLISATVANAGFAARVPHTQRRADYDYSRRAPLWDCRMQPGLYTEFGICTPLVAATDDAVAIFGAGEEVQLRFDAVGTPRVAPGMNRTWTLEVDGWCKDMDMLTGDGATLGPLPLRDGKTTTPTRDALHTQFNVRWAGGR